jgi:hypothetical protein
MSVERKTSPRVVMPHATAGRTTADKLRSFTQTNPRMIPHLVRTLVRGGREKAAVAAFRTYSEQAGFEFSYDGVSNNIPFVTPLLREFADTCGRDPIRYLEIGAYEGRNLAFLDWLLPGRLEVTVIDPWFNPEFNPDENYHAIESRFHRNVARMRFRAVTCKKTFSGAELPLMRQAGAVFDLIYVDGSHAALDVLIDLCFCASLLAPGGMMILDDYWHDISDIGGPGVKQAVDQFICVFGRYFGISAVYRQVVLIKTDEIPR